MCGYSLLLRHSVGKGVITSPRRRYSLEKSAKTTVATEQLFAWWIPMLGDYYPKLYVQQWRCSCCFLGYSCGQGCQSWHQCNQVWSNKPVRCCKLSKTRCYQELWLLLIKNIVSAMDYQEMLLPYGKANLKQVQHNSNAMKKAQSCLTCVCGTDSGGCSPWGGCKSYLDRSLPLLWGNLALMPQSGQDRGCKHTDMCWLLLR